MSEQPSSVKSPDIPALPRGAISMKGLPLNRNTRLPTIRSPRDLTLGAQPKRVFTPNIPIRREKKLATPDTPQSSQSSSSTVNKKDKKFPSGDSNRKQKPRSYIQTEGSLFGEGVSPVPFRNASKERDSAPRFTPKKPVVKKEMDMSEVERDINEILRDDFIDDGEDDDDENDDIKPIVYPLQNNVDKSVKKEVPKLQNFEKTDFAKEMGFDVNKIAKYIKKEKEAEPAKTVTVPKINISENCQNDLIKILNSGEQMFLMQFPRDFNIIQPEDSPINFETEQTYVKNKEKPGLSSLPEGPIGKLQVLRSGCIRLVCGENIFYLNQGSSLKCKHEVVSIRTGDQNDLIVLGNIEHKVVATPDVEKLGKLSRKH